MRSTIDKLIEMNETNIRNMSNLIDTHASIKQELDNTALVLSSTKIDNMKLLEEVDKLNKEMNKLKSDYINLLESVRQSSSRGEIFDVNAFFNYKKPTIH